MWCPISPFLLSSFIWKARFLSRISSILMTCCKSIGPTKFSMDWCVMCRNFQNPMIICFSIVEVLVSFGQPLWGGWEGLCYSCLIASFLLMKGRGFGRGEDGLLAIWGFSLVHLVQAKLHSKIRLCSCHCCGMGLFFWLPYGHQWGALSGGCLSRRFGAIGMLFFPSLFVCVCVFSSLFLWFLFLWTPRPRLVLSSIIV